MIFWYSPTFFKPLLVHNVDPTQGFSNHHRMEIEATTTLPWTISYWLLTAYHESFLLKVKGGKLKMLTFTPSVIARYNFYFSSMRIQNTFGTILFWENVDDWIGWWTEGPDELDWHKNWWNMLVITLLPVFNKVSGILETVNIVRKRFRKVKLLTKSVAIINMLQTIFFNFVWIF